MPRQQMKIEAGGTQQSSSWTPTIKHIMENCIENKLDSKDFPFITRRPVRMVSTPVR